MRTVEIQSKEWATFCEDFTRIYRGGLVTIEMLDEAKKRIEVAKNMPLEKMAWDQDGACNNVISISVSEPGRRAIDHLVIEPIYLIVRENDKHGKTLEIAAENGKTLVAFHSGKLPDAAANADWPFARRVAPEKERYVCER
jgi:hypothetical protein